MDILGVRYKVSEINGDGGERYIVSSTRVRYNVGDIEVD